MAWLPNLFDDTNSNKVPQDVVGMFIPPLRQLIDAAR